jgi:aspartyl protease family protein
MNDFGRLAMGTCMTLLWAGLASAQSVALSGSMGADKALLMIDGLPQVLAVGATAKGVTLKRLADGEAQIEVAGRLSTLRLGAQPSRMGGSSDPAANYNQIVLAMGPGGHFAGQGSINGKAVNFLVDTGATAVSMSQSEANRIGLDWKRGKPGITSTANGPAPVYSINLSSVRVGNVEIANVAAVVVPAEMPMILLGNSFLGRFNLRQDGDVMRLEKK